MPRFIVTLHQVESRTVIAHMEGEIQVEASDLEEARRLTDTLLRHDLDVSLDELHVCWEDKTEKLQDAEEMSTAIERIKLLDPNDRRAQEEPDLTDDDFNEEEDDDPDGDG